LIDDELNDLVGEHAEKQWAHYIEHFHYTLELDEYNVARLRRVHKGYEYVATIARCHSARESNASVQDFSDF
jgi:uncharacterized protein YeaO (DUF488 family)